MKKQYLGDVRDLFKYDLIQQVLRGILKGRSSLQKFTFIPMLTEYDPKSREGNKRDFTRAKEKGRPGTKNKKLMKVLKKYKEMVPNKRDFTEIEMYFKSNGIKMLLYEDKRREYFEHSPGDEYFKNIPKNVLRTPLVFIDPDIGLEIKIKNSTKKHLLFSEAKYLYKHIYKHIDKDSILMIYQHFPRARKKYPEYLPEGRSKQLEEKLRNLPIYISDNEIMFFLLTRSDRLRSQLGRIIKGYKGDYKNLKIGGAIT